MSSNNLQLESADSSVLQLAYSIPMHTRMLGTAEIRLILQGGGLIDGYIADQVFGSAFDYRVYD